MKHALLPEALTDGDTNINEDTVLQILALPLNDDAMTDTANISLGKTQLETWANENHTEVVGWKYDYARHEGKGILRLTMYGKMLRPELAYKGDYPVYEHEREGYVGSIN